MGPWQQRRLPGGTHIRSHRRHSLFYHHAADRGEKTQRQGEGHRLNNTPGLAFLYFYLQPGVALSPSLPFFASSHRRPATGAHSSAAGLVFAHRTSTSSGASSSV